MNSRLNSVLDNRDTTSFFISVGTGLMLETLFEPSTNRIDDSRVVEKIVVNDFKVHYYNIFTLIRNILHSVSNSELKRYLLKDSNGPSAVVEVLITELEIIKELYSNTSCKPILFIPTYKTVYSKVSNVINPADMNDAKLHQHNFNLMCVKIFNLSHYNNIDIIKADYKLPIVSGNSLITTHYTFDLLNVLNNKRLFLLESHTGRLKDKSMFNTKYHNLGKLDKTVFPFNEILLYILGDNTLIKPFKFKVRSELHKLAMDKKWTSFTSEAKIKTNIKTSMKDILDISTIKTLF